MIMELASVFILINAKVQTDYFFFPAPPASGVHTSIHHIRTVRLHKLI